MASAKEPCKALKAPTACDNCMDDAIKPGPCRYGDKCTRIRNNKCYYRHCDMRLCKDFRLGACNKNKCQFSHTMPPCTHNNAPSQSVAAVSDPLKGSANGDGDGFEEYCSDVEFESNVFEEDELAKAAEQQHLLNELAAAQQAYHILLALLHKLMPNKTDDEIWHDALRALDVVNQPVKKMAILLPVEDCP